MSKLNMYRAFVLFCLAIVAYIWNFIAFLICTWWALALLEYWLDKRFTKLE
jgi:hypothetical protein